MSKVELQDHELLVTHVEKGREMIISKKLYHSDPDSYEVIDGEPGEPSKKDEFVFTKAPEIKTKEETPVKPAPEKKKKVAPPKL